MKFLCAEPRRIRWRLRPKRRLDLVQALDEFAQFRRKILDRGKVRGQRLSYRMAHYRFDLGAIGDVMKLAGAAGHRTFLRHGGKRRNAGTVPVAAKFGRLRSRAERGQGKAQENEAANSAASRNT